VVILSPYRPLLFMGQEYGETAPFLYYTNHSDPDLVEAVRRGRKQEFSSFSWQGEPPDPQAESTFLQSKLRPEQIDQRGQILYNFYRELIRLRRLMPALAHPSKEAMEVITLDDEQAVFVRRWNGLDQACIVFHFSSVAGIVKIPLPRGSWGIILDSDAEQWMGSGRLALDFVASSGEIEIVLPPKSAVMFDLLSES
jgi:maltooligosyltrehalose trehalohydrolase